jgi:two-component system chemotaxis response regulator CheB
VKAMPDQNIILDYLSHEKTNKDFSGFVEEMSLADIVQLACLSGKDRQLEIFGEGFDGLISFAQGEVVHAACRDLVGEEAFFKIMSHKAGAFHLKNAVIAETTINTPWNFLLIEAVRRADEIQLPEQEEDTKNLSVLVVDDSKIISQAIEKIFVERLGIENIFNAHNGKEALQIIKEKTVDIITLDINMPVMAGDLALKHIMIKSPSPVILMTGVNKGNISKIMEFMRLGAIDFIPKPADNLGWDFVASRLEKIVKDIKALKFRNFRRAIMPRPCLKKRKPFQSSEKLLIIFAGIGGILEIQKIVASIPDSGALSVICFLDMVQDVIPAFSSYLDKYSHYTVSHLQDKSSLFAVRCHIAGWDASWEIATNGHAVYVQLMQGKRLDANRLLASAAEIYGVNFMTVVLSGTVLNMKSGLDEVINKGGRIFVQTPETALYPGPLEKLISYEMEEGCIEPDELPGLVNAWLTE